MTKKDKISKRINKIIPALLLSGAMLVPMSQLTSPIVANAYENSYSNTQKSVFTPKITNLADVDFKKTSSETFTLDDKVCVPSKSEITIDLTNKEYHRFESDLAPHRGSEGVSLNFEFYVDGKLVQDISTSSSRNKKHVGIDLYSANELKIVVKDNSNPNYSFFGELINPKFTTYTTSYSKKYDEKVTYEDSRYQNASKTTMYVGSNNYPYHSLVSDRIVTFNSESTDPVVSERPTSSVSSTKGNIRYLGSSRGSIGLGCRVRYEVLHATRTKYFYNENGVCIKVKEVPFVSKTPLSDTLEYNIVSTSKF